MNRMLRLVLIILLLCVVAAAFVSCDGFDAFFNESEGTEATSDADEKESATEAETEKPNPLAKIIYISLDRHKGQCTVYWGERQGSRTGRGVTGATRFLYNTKKNSVYQEVKISSIGSADGTGVEIKEGNELKHLIIVFEKGYKLTENDKSVLAELGIDYMFEK